MIRRLIYNNKAFKMLEQYQLDFSNNEVTFSDIVIDFTNKSIADIPLKYQEVEIRETEKEQDILNGEVIFTGYVDNANVSEMKLEDEEREMTLTLLSPLKMATLRSITLIGTYKVSEVIKRILQPLVDDGFILKELNVQDGQITLNHILQTVEYCMNDLGNKRNIFWYINEKKEIFVNSIEYLFSNNAKKTISHNKKENGFLNIIPTIENTDYCNIINFKNVRLIYSNTFVKDYPIMALEKHIKKGDIVNFDNPIIIDEEHLRNYIKENQGNESTYYSIGISITISDSDSRYYTIKIENNEAHQDYNKFVIDNRITFSNDGGEEGEIVLQRDSFFSNLITGFKWNVDFDAIIRDVYSDTALRYTTMRFMYSNEIENLKGIISKSGQIEKTKDYAQKWTTLPQLIKYARSLMTQNSNIISGIVLKYDENPNLKIGDLIDIQLPMFYSNGKFAVKSIKYTYINDIEQAWEITAKTTDLISSYIDMFRPVEQETPADTIDNVILSEFIEESIIETHTVELNNSEHTLNFNL